MDLRKMPAVGEIAPEFSIRDSTGAERTLSQLAAGGLCVLVFYRGHW